MIEREITPYLWVHPDDERSGQRTPCGRCKARRGCASSQAPDLADAIKPGFMPAGFSFEVVNRCSASRNRPVGNIIKTLNLDEKSEIGFICFWRGKQAEPIKTRNCLPRLIWLVRSNAKRESSDVQSAVAQSIERSRSRLPR